jgi:hypothetical protein
MKHLARISHTPSVVTQNAVQEPIFPQALASRPFWVGIAGRNQLRRAPKTAETIFSFVPRLISSTAPRGCCGFLLQVLVEIEVLRF